MRIGTYNCQGLILQKVKKQYLADDIEKYKLSAMAIQETHMRNECVEMIKSSSGKMYLLHFSGMKDVIENVSASLFRNERCY